MPLPASGPISMSQFNTELNRTFNTANSQLAGTSVPSIGSLVYIAGQSGSLDQNAPHSFSEWYNYSLCCLPTIDSLTNDGTTITVNFTLGPCGTCNAVEIQSSSDNITWGGSNTAGCTSPRTYAYTAGVTNYIRIRTACGVSSYSNYTAGTAVPAPVSPSPTPTPTVTPSITPTPTITPSVSPCVCYETIEVFSSTGGVFTYNLCNGGGPVSDLLPAGISVFIDNPTYCIDITSLGGASNPVLVSYGLPCCAPSVTPSVTPSITATPTVTPTPSTSQPSSYSVRYYGTYGDLSGTGVQLNSSTDGGTTWTPWANPIGGPGNCDLIDGEIINAGQTVLLSVRDFLGNPVYFNVSVGGTCPSNSATYCELGSPYSYVINANTDFYVTVYVIANDIVYC